MKKLKKLISVMLLIGITLLVACGNEEPVVEEPVVPPTLYIYTADESVVGKFDYVLEGHEDWKERVEFVTLPEEEFPEQIEKILADESSEKYPDIIISDYSDVAAFVNSENILSIAELGLENVDFSGMYDYTKAFATDSEGTLKGLTWEITPGAFVYRKSLAAEYLGFDDEKNVQSFVKDWDTMIDTARRIYNKSGKSVKMLPSAHDIEKVFAGGCWVDGDNPVVNSSAEKMLDVMYALNKGDFVQKLDEGSEQYYKAANQNNIFGYFADYGVLLRLEDSCNGDAKSDWAVCMGPQGFISGGQWIFASGRCCDTELAAQIIKVLCTDNGVLKKFSENDNVLVNNKNIVSNAYNTGKGKIGLLGGGDYIKVFDMVAKNCELAAGSKNDAKLEALYFSHADSYIDGSKIKDQIREEYMSGADGILHPVVVEEEAEKE